MLILPFLLQPEVRDLSKVWDDPANKKLLDNMPDVFKVPGRDAPPGHTYYRCFISDERVTPVTLSQFIWHKGMGPRMSFSANLSRNTDRWENSLMVVEAEEAVPWTKPEGLFYDGKAPLPKLGGHAPNRFLAAFANARVSVIDRSKLDDATLRAMITWNGGEPLDVPKMRGDPPEPKK